MARGEKIEKPGSVLPRLVKGLRIAKEFNTRQLFYHWESVVGRTIALHVRPVRLDFHTLYLKADAPVWANQLVFMQEELLQRINGFVAGRLVKEIRFCREQFWKKPPAVKAEAEPEAEEPVYKLTEPSADERLRAEEICGIVSSEELRQAARRAMERMQARRRAQQEEGWRACSRCGMLCPKGQDICDYCQNKNRADTRRRIRRYLEIKPWVTYGEIFEQFECSPELLRDVRVGLMQSWLSRITYSKEDREGELAKKLVMLYTARRPEEVSDELREKILKKLRFDMRPAPKPEAKEEKAAAQKR